jgi:hypothetical protein
MQLEYFKVVSPVAFKGSWNCREPNKFKVKNMYF